MCIRDSGIDYAAERETGITQQPGNQDHVGFADQLVGHQHPANPMFPGGLHLRRGGQGDAPGAGFQLQPEQCRACLLYTSRCV